MKRPALVLRDSTEWKELVAGGFAVLCAEPSMLEEAHKTLTKSIQNVDFNGDVGAEQIMVVHHTWNCGILSYSGLATASGCGGTDPGKFTITTAATYLATTLCGYRSPTWIAFT